MWIEKAGERGSAVFCPFQSCHKEKLYQHLKFSRVLLPIFRLLCSEKAPLFLSYAAGCLQMALLSVPSSPFLTGTSTFPSRNKILVIEPGRLRFDFGNQNIEKIVHSLRPNITHLCAGGRGVSACVNGKCTRQQTRANISNQDVTSVDVYNSLLFFGSFSLKVILLLKIF